MDNLEHLWVIYNKKEKVKDPFYSIFPRYRYSLWYCNYYLRQFIFSLLTCTVNVFCIIDTLCNKSQFSKVLYFLASVFCTIIVFAFFYFINVYERHILEITGFLIIILLINLILLLFKFVHLWALKDANSKVFDDLDHSLNKILIDMESDSICLQPRKFMVIVDLLRFQTEICISAYVGDKSILEENVKELQKYYPLLYKRSLQSVLM